MSDGSSIIDAYSIVADGTALGEFAADTAVPLGLEAQVLRFNVVASSGGNTGAIEIVVLGEGPAGSP